MVAVPAPRAREAHPCGPSLALSSAAKLGAEPVRSGLTDCANSSGFLKDWPPDPMATLALRNRRSQVRILSGELRKPRYGGISCSMDGPPMRQMSVWATRRATASLSH
jgi:hypothetical protein